MIREGTIQLPFTFAAGKAASAVLNAIEKDQVILASSCSPCALTVAPARSFCPDCGSANLEAVEAGPQGTLQAWSEVPGRSIFGLVLLAGTDRPMVHRILAPVATLFTGAGVTPCFEPTAEGGEKIVLRGFKLAGGAT